MAKFELRMDEKLIGNAAMSHSYTTFLFPTVTQGKFYVTDQRVSFYENLSGYVYMELELSDVLGFTKKGAGILLKSKEDKKYFFSGFSVKKVQEWLKESGITEGK